jgi:putative DNA primase/helicase
MKDETQTDRSSSNDLHFDSDHLKDLKKSGLSDETIRKAEIYSVPPRDINKILGSLGSGLEARVSSLLAFPYPNCDGFIQWKLFPPIKNKDGHTIRYFQLKGSLNHLYIPGQVISILPDVSVPIYITEGVKKALKACQDGLPCIALIGLWNWSDGSEDKNLIPDFDKVTLRGREVFIVPDNDWLSPNRRGEQKNLKDAVHGLAYRLIDRGAKPFIVQLPEGSLKGIDDYLCRHSIEEFKKLSKSEIRKRTIDEMIEEGFVDDRSDILKRIASLPMESDKEIYIEKFSKKFHIPKSAIRVDLQKTEGKGIGKDEKIEKLLNSESSKQTRFSAMEFINDQLFYGGIWDGKKVLLRSDGEIRLSESDEEFKFIRSKLTQSVAKRYRAEEIVKGKDLVEHLVRLFSNHIFFSDKRIPLLLALWTMGTYFFKAFKFYGYVLINSPVKQCGKSLLLDLLSHICFNSTSRLIVPSEASVFREVDANDSTLIIDEVESLGEKDREKNAGLIALLNGGFQKDSKVSRVEKIEGNKIDIAYFSAYSPKALAGIKKVVATIEDRSHRITMKKKLETEKILRFDLRKQEKEVELLREDLYLWALRNVADVIEVYGRSDEFKRIEPIDDRQRDILEPLLSIASIIDAESDDEGQKTYRQLVDLALDMSTNRHEREQLDATIPTMITIMGEFLGEESERFVSSEDLLTKVKNDDGLNFISTKWKLAGFLSKFDLHTGFHRQDGKPKRGYLISQKWVEETKARYQ